MTISYADFEKVDIRLGKIVDVEDFPEARKPAYKLKIDFGPELGIKKIPARNWLARMALPMPMAQAG